MKILILSWRGPGHPNAGGAEISTHEHAKGWVKAGHKVTLFTSYYEGAKEYGVINGVSIIRRGNQVFGVHLKAALWYLFNKHEQFDLIIDQFHGIPFFTPLYIRRKKLAFIHEVSKEVWRLNPWKWPLKLLPAIIGTMFEPLVFKFLYRNIPFMTVAESTKKDLMEWGIHRDNISIIYNGVNKPKHYRNRKEKRTTLTFLGVLTKDKGIETAIDTFHYLQHHYRREFQFWIIGKGDTRYVHFLKKKIKGNELKNVKFWGFISENRKFDLLGKSHILVNPSVREGWGLVVIEAAEVGTPSIAFDVPGLRDSIIDNKTGILCKEYTAESLAENFFKLIIDRKKYNELCKNARKWGKKFSWEKATRESIKLLNKIME